MTATNIAEVLKLAAKPIQYDNDEKTWLEFRFKLENCLTLVDERYVALLLNAESQPVANLPTGTEESAVTMRTLSHTLYALLATLTTGRSLRSVQRVPNRNGFEAWRQMAAENAPKTAGRRFAMLQAVLQPGMSDNLAKFEETWKSWEHQKDIYENLSSTKLNDDVKISVVFRECPQKLRDHLPANSQQFESNYNKLRAIIQAYLNTNKTWIVNDFRETDPMDVDYIGKSNRKGKSKSKSQGKSKGKNGSKNIEAKTVSRLVWKTCAFLAISLVAKFLPLRVFLGCQKSSRRAPESEIVQQNDKKTNALRVPAIPEVDTSVCVRGFGFCFCLPSDFADVCDTHVSACF